MFNGKHVLCLDTPPKEQELAVFDLLIKPDLTLTKKEGQEVKKVAQDLLSTLKREKLVLN